jgi:hypothetical protein
MQMNICPSGVSLISKIVQILGWSRADAARLLNEPPLCVDIEREFWGEELQRHKTLQLRVLGFKDDAHPAFAEFLDNSVV